MGLEENFDEADRALPRIQLDLKRFGSIAYRQFCDFLVPPHCLLCRKPVGESGSLCPDCWSTLRFIEEPCCPRLGIPFPYDPGAGQVSAAALADPPSWNRARSAVAYDDASKPIVHALKYRDRHEAVLFMMRLMARAGAQLLSEADLVVPVPLHRIRLWQRRFNQAALIAQRLCQKSPDRFQPMLLARSKSTRPQVGLDHEERRKNVRGAFTVPGRHLNKIAGKRILIVDDVMTTGATAAACTTVLLRAGAANIDVLTFALVLEPRRLHM